MNVQPVLLSLVAATAAISLSVFPAAVRSAPAKRALLIEITDPAVRPGDALHVWVACPTDMGSADVRSPATGYTALARSPAGTWRFAAPPTRSGTRPGDLALQARCAGRPGAPGAAGSVPFRVSAAPQKWAAESRTAESITGNVSFTPVALTFAVGGRLRIRYLGDVSSAVSALGSFATRAHAQLFRVESPSDLQLRAGNALCGARPSYLSVLRTAGALDADIVVTVYSGATPPNGTPSDTICASYTYAPVPS